MLRRITTENINRLGPTLSMAKETSFLGVKPGGVIQFSYLNTIRLGVVVASRRTSNGLFLSSKSLLMNVVLLDGLSDSLFTVLVNNLYNNDYASDYRNLPVIMGISKVNNFRTFKVGLTKDIITLTLDVGERETRRY